MKLLYPQNNYTINEAVLRNKPVIRSDSHRQVMLPNDYSETVRRSKFSFATMEMLKTDPITKLLFLQEPVLEKRYANMLKVMMMIMIMHIVYDSLCLSVLLLLFILSMYWRCINQSIINAGVRREHCLFRRRVQAKRIDHDWGRWVNDGWWWWSEWWWW